MPFQWDDIDEWFVTQVLERYWEDIQKLSIVAGKEIYEIIKLWASAKGKEDIISVGEEMTHVIFGMVSSAFIEGLREWLTRYARGDKTLSVKK